MSLSEIGPYRLLRPLKSGGEGSVYLAEDRRLNRRVALKLKPLTREPRARQAAIEEARLLASFSHHLIVQLYDVRELPDTLVLVMEFIPGSDLEELLAVTGFEQGAVVHIALDLCAALALAHDHGVIHGDLKPSNVLLAEDGHSKLMDFGIGLRGDSGAVAAGSAAAMAPELLETGRCDVRTDLFALGCLLYRLLARRHPFPAGRYTAGAAPLPLDDLGVSVHETLSAVVFGLLATDPADRPQSALEARRQLLAIARDFPAGDAAELVQLSARLNLPVASALETSLDVREVEPAGVSYRALLLFLVAVVGAGALTAGSWLSEATDTRVRLGEVTVVGSAPLGQARMAEMLQQAVLARQGLVIASPGSEDSVLTLYVNCNPYVCSSQLVREGASVIRSDIRTLLPGDPEQVWRHRLDQGIRDLFAAGR